LRTIGEGAEVGGEVMMIELGFGDRELRTFGELPGGVGEGFTTIGETPTEGRVRTIGPEFAP
jgi:hypothetical protein